MTVLLTKAQAARDDARQEAQEKRQAFDQAHKRAVASGADLSPDSDAFKQLDEADNARSLADAALDRANDYYMRMVDIEGAASGSPASDSAAAKIDIESAAGMSIKQIAAQLTQQDSYKEIAAMLERGGRISESMNIGQALDRGQLMMLLTGESIDSAGAFVAPDRKPYVQDNVEAQRLRELVSVGTTNSNLVDYVRLDRRPNSAAVVRPTTSVVPGAEDGLAPMGEATFEVKAEKVVDVSELIPAHRNSIADAGQFQTILNDLLAFDLERCLESSMLMGEGSDNREALLGVYNVPGVNKIEYSSYNPLEQIRRGLTAARLRGEEPHWIAINPLDAQLIAFMRDETGGAGTGQYLAGTPFGAQSDRLWGKPLVETSAVPEGIPLVGTTNAWHLWIREGLTVQIANQHKDWFQRGVYALLALIRAALTVERPGGFSLVEITS